MTNNLRVSMDAVLKETVLPALRSSGFKGSFAHFRRFTNDSVELLTFQFDKWGGGFIVEIACGSIDGFTMPWGEHIPAKKLTAHHLHPNNRTRIQPIEGSGADAWFRFDDGNVNQTAQEVLERLPIAESWWQDQACLASRTGL
jgi:hypothetical protein